MKPLSPDQWNREHAAHLLVRSGFGATPEQIAQTAKLPMNKAVDLLFKPATDVKPPDWVVPGIQFRENRDELRDLTEEERRIYRRLVQREFGQQQRNLVDWWINRMISTSCPLQEKMTLFLHGHFATSIQKVRVPYMMYLQNQTFRENALGNWRTLVTAVSQDPAMLVYLDNTQSRAGAPNENYARELMELFTLGEGHYTEQDIKEAARALTGWMVDPREYAFLDASKAQPATRFGRGLQNRLHDDGEKTFFGRTGNFDGHDLIRIILEQEQAARFIAEKFWRFFAYENPEPEIVDAMAEQLRLNDYELAPVLRTMFKSEAFYSQKAIRTQIKSPTQWLVGSCIALNIDQSEGAFVNQALRTLGQELFAPPNVKGWDGGYAWITTASLTERYNLAKRIINFRNPGQGQRSAFAVDTAAVLPWDQRENMETARNYLEERIYQARLPDGDQEKMNGFLASQPPPGDWTDEQVRNILHVMMSTPQYQLT